MNKKELIPSPTSFSKGYWDGCSRNELLVQKCNACLRLQFYPRTICSNCWSMDLSWIKSEGIGEILTYTIVHRPPSSEFKDEVPYVVVVVRLREGYNMIGYLRRWTDADAITIGGVVKVCFERMSDDISLPVFEMA